MTYKDNWFRVAALTEGAVTLFEEKLRKARSSRDQYMDIQAGALVQAGAFAKALLLLDRLLTEYPDYFSLTGVEQLRAKCFLGLGDQASAITAYRNSIEHIRRLPSVRGNAPLSFVYWVADQGISECYEEAVAVAFEFWDDSPLFPVTGFMQHAALALLCDERGDIDGTIANACAALAWAERSQSNAVKHRSLGLVSTEFLPMLRRMAAIATAPTTC